MADQGTLFKDPVISAMSDTEKLAQLMEVGSTMRIFQKAYYSSPPGDFKKRNLIDSKKAEKEFDSLLTRLKQ